MDLPHLLFLPEHSSHVNRNYIWFISCFKAPSTLSGSLIGTRSTDICAVNDCLQPSDINVSKNLQNRTTTHFFCLLLAKWRVPNSPRINELRSKWWRRTKQREYERDDHTMCWLAQKASRPLIKQSNHGRQKMEWNVFLINALTSLCSRARKYNNCIRIWKLFPPRSW